MARYTKEHISGFYKQGDFEKAYLALQAVVKDYPEDGGIYALWADLEMRVNGDLSRAEYLMKEAQHLGCPEGYYHRISGDLLWRKGQLEEAVMEYEKSVTAEPSLNNWSTFAEALSVAGDNRAIVAWENVLQKDPKNCLAYVYLAREAGRRNDLSKASDMIKQAERLRPSDAELLFEIGSVCHALEDYRKALRYLLKAERKGLQKAGKSEPLHSQIACCYLNLDDGVSAIRRAVKGAELEPENSYARETLNACKEHALGLCAKKQYIKAYPMMSIALDIWPDDSRLLAYMADLEMAFKHNYEAGKSYMKRAFECNNAELDLLYEIKGSLWYDCLNDKKESLACLEKAVSLNRSNFNLVALASRIIDTDPKRADQLFEEVLLSDPKEADVIDELARIALKKEDWQKGFELATRAHKLEPSDAGINASLAYANQKLGRFDEALSLYLKAEEFGFYDKVFIYNSMAECYQGLGNSKEARVYAKKVLDINLDDAKANRLLDQLSQ